jgi:transglutaminase/protease-like cytokinesis protein 3
VAELSTRDLPSAAVTEAIDYVFSEQLIAASDHANVAVTSPVRTPAAKTANKTTNTRAHLVRDDAQKTGKPGRSRRGEEDSIVKREPKKLPTEPASPVTKTTNTQKPKVIQWP